MSENTVKIDISFRSLLDAVSSLGTAEKHQLLEFVEAELCSGDEDSPDDIADIQAARADYKSGDYTTFDLYMAERVKRSV